MSRFYSPDFTFFEPLINFAKVRAAHQPNVTDARTERHESSDLDYFQPNIYNVVKTQDDPAVNSSGCTEIGHNVFTLTKDNTTEEFLRY